MTLLHPRTSKCRSIQIISTYGIFCYYLLFTAEGEIVYWFFRLPRPTDQVWAPSYDSNRATEWRQNVWHPP